MNGPVSDRLRRLARLPESKLPVVSAYLDTKADAPGKKDAVRIFLKNKLREAEGILDGRAERESFAADAKKILAFVDDELHRTHSGEGHAIFACAGDGLFEVIPSQRPFENQLLIATRPLLRQLAIFLDEYEGVLAALVDSRIARIFEISLDRKVVEFDIEAGGPSETTERAYHGFGDLKYRREVRGHLDEHLKEVAAELTRRVDQQHYRRLVLLGQDAAVGGLRKALPKRVDERVIATASLDKREARDRVVARVLEIAHQEEKREERELIALIRDQALSGNLGVFGLDATLNALRKGQVYKLALADDLRSRGWRGACGGLTTHLKKDACPYCGCATDPVELGDEVVKDALALGAEIETVRGSADLDRMGKVGALLRFRD